LGEYVDKSHFFSFLDRFSNEINHSIFLFTIFADYSVFVGYGNGTKQPD